MKVPRWRDLRSRSALPPATVRDPFQYRLFAETFAAYLRQNKTRWRLRRTDRFSPLDLNLAERRIKLDLKIDRRLLNEFLDLYGRDLRIPPGGAREAREVTAFIPVLSHRKALLLQARQTLNGKHVPGLQRYDESRILARDLLAGMYALQKRPSGADSLSPELEDPRRMAPLRVVMSTLLFIDPHRLKERLVKWCEDNASGRFLIRNIGLADESTLLEWIEQEGDEFSADLGHELRCALQPLVRQHLRNLLNSSDQLRAGEDSVLLIDSDHRPGGLAYFPTLELLLLHGVQDLLKMIIETTSPQRAALNELSPRARLMATPAELAKQARATVDETRTLVKLIRNQDSEHAFVDFLQHLDRWISYAVVTFRPGAPFTISFEDVSPLDRPGGEPLNRLEKLIRLVWRTTHWYPLPLRDALSVHVEVVSPETEIIAKECDVMVRESDGSLRHITGLFGHKVEPNERLLHRYSSKRPADGTETDVDRQMSSGVWLEVRYKLLGSVKLAYCAALFAFAAAALFVATVTGWSLYDSRTDGLVIDSVLVATLGTTLALWLITTQYRLPIVHRKLSSARWTMYIAIAVILGSVAVLGISRFVSPPRRHSLPSSSTYRHPRQR